jgi:hypothetical protein
VPSVAEQAGAALARSHTDRMATLAERTGDTFEAEFVRLVDGLDDEVLARWLAEAVPLSRATREGAALASQGYVQSLAAFYGHPVGELAPLAELVAGLRDVTDVEQWTRPMVAARTAASKGLSFREAVAQGARQAASLARTDVGLASRAASSQAMAVTDGVEGYRRVPEPGACAFCRLIATNRYGMADLAPAHTNCSCGVVPIFDDADPGAVISAKVPQAGTADAADALAVEGTTSSEIGPQTPHVTEETTTNG